MLQAFGGLGLFLMGMAVMTDGLKTLADERLRTLLAKSTRSPLAGVFTGGISTAILQSSSATTVAAIGFVSAGLLTFPQALGIVFGASIGTTFTGWLVAVLGFKLKLGELVLPLVLVGVLLRLFGRGRVAASGFSIAGFGLIFVGITMLQEGMKTFEGIVTPATLPSDTLPGRLALVLIGIVVTLITQSSSAGVATALAALNTGTITLSQAAALVIGMDVGTTSTALLATIGATTQARRTAMGHVLYNVLTAFLALLILTPYVHLVERFSSPTGPSEPELALVAFHTLFNCVGLVVILPFTKRFAAFITRLVPERGNPLTRRLEQSLLTTPDVAMQAVRATILDLVRHVFDQLATVLAIASGLQGITVDCRRRGRAGANVSVSSPDSTGGATPSDVLAARIIVPYSRSSSASDCTDAKRKPYDRGSCRPPTPRTCRAAGGRRPRRQPGSGQRRRFGGRSPACELPRTQVTRETLSTTNHRRQRFRQDRCLGNVDSIGCCALATSCRLSRVADCPASACVGCVGRGLDSGAAEEAGTGETGNTGAASRRPGCRASFVKPLSRSWTSAARCRESANGFDSRLCVRRSAQRGELSGGESHLDDLIEFGRVGGPLR